MIALALNLLLTIGAIQALLLVQRVWLLQQGLHKIQDNARIVQIYFAQILQSAGALSCNRMHAGLIPHFINADKETFGLTPAGVQIIQADSLKDNPYLSPHFFERVVADFPILWVWSIAEIDNLTDTEDKILCFNDCIRAYFFKHRVPIKSLTPFSLKIWLARQGVSWLAQGKLVLVHSRLFYVGRTSRMLNHYPVYALYMTDLNGTSEELIEGVQMMKIAIENNHPRKLKMTLLLDSVQSKSIQKTWAFEWTLPC